MPTPTPVFPALLPPGQIGTLLSGKQVLPGRVRQGFALGAVFALSGSLSLAAAAPRAQPHTFTDTSGKTYQAQVLVIRNGEVNIRRPNGKVFSVDINTLSKADREYLKTWSDGSVPPKDSPATPDSALEVKVAVESSTGSQGEKVLTPRVTLLNQEAQVNLQGIKGTLILVSAPTGNPARCTVLAVEKFTGNIPARKQFDFSGQPLSPTATAEPASAAKGYLLVLQNSNDEVIQYRHAGPFPQNALETLKLRPASVFEGQPAPVGQDFRLVKPSETWGPMPTDARPAPGGHS